MARYRKKLVVIEAEQWFPGQRVGGLVLQGDPGFPVHYTDEQGRRAAVPVGCAWIGTLEGGHLVTHGDWIITGVKGERYACKTDVFEATYEPADIASGCQPQAPRGKHHAKTSSIGRRGPASTSEAMDPCAGRAAATDAR